LKNLEFPINFERFTKAKTIDNVVAWMKESMSEVKLLHKDMNQLVSDGASNAIGSVAELEASTRVHRANDVEITICAAHQNQRAGGFASGSTEFAEPVNIELGELLNKSHRLQTFMNRAPNRIHVYRSVQVNNYRNPMLLPKPAGDTRWDSKHDETKRAVLIVNDFNATMKKLLSVDGDDHHLLTAHEKIDNNIDRYTYTGDDHMTLRQFEQSSLEAKLFTKFTQEKGSSNNYLLLELMTVLQNTSADYFTMPAGTYEVCHFLGQSHSIELTITVAPYIIQQAPTNLTYVTANPTACWL
jgi:hypothetical protein